MLENAIIPDGAIPDLEVVPETAKEKLERERLSRRQALKRLGMTSAMTAFALFSVDDLARVVGKAMQQRAGDNKVAEQVAKELQQAGVALAQPGTPCLHCMSQYAADSKAIDAAYQACLTANMQQGPQMADQICTAAVICPQTNNAQFDYNGCCAANCGGACISLAVPDACRSPGLLGM